MFQKVIQPAHMLVDDERLNYDGRPGNEIIAKVFDAAPGAESIALLLNIEKSELSPADRVTYLKCWQKQASWVNFQEQEALLYVSGSHYQENSGEFDVDNESREEVAAALRFHTPSQVAKKIKTVFANIAPEVYKEHFELQRQVRKIQLIKEDGGTGTILATLKIEDAQFADQVINDYADTILANLREQMLTDVKFCRSHKCIKECLVKCAHACSEYCKEECLVLNFDNQEALDALDQANSLDLDFERNVRRADAFIAAMKAADAALKANGTIITRHNRRPTINVTIDLPTALGLAENPGQLAGYGPIPANIAREIAADGRWKRFVTDPITGTLIDYGRETYEPPQNLQDFLIARDRTCRFPGCRQPAHLADLDHAIPWDEGGTTSAGNLGALCRRHHNLKTHGGWQLINGVNGACTWISPTGARYEVPARPIMDAI
jgi:hypothetical protein